MRLQQFVLIGISACLSQGVQIPKDAENGVYVAVDDGNGGLKPELLSRHVESTRDTLDRRDPTPGAEIGCEGSGLSYSDLSRAQAALYDYCGASNVIPSPSNYISYKINDAIAYSCNYGGPNTCADHEAKAAFAEIAGHCGVPSAPVGGWYWMEDWAKNYGYISAGDGFCTNL